MKSDFKEFKKFIKGKKTAVVGIGVSNIPLIKYLVKLDANVTAFDRKEKNELDDTVLDFINYGVKLELGENYLDKLKGFDVIFKTPSMRIDSEALLRAKVEGAYITSEMDEFIRYCPAKIFGVTGSDGKTTTATIIYTMLKEQGYRTWIGGNIGNPLFAEIENIKKEDKVVLELSSFQLMTINVSPEVSVVTNLTPNHLDMHKGMEEYIKSKKNIYKYQNNNDILVLNKDNNITNKMKQEAKGNVLEFSTKGKIENGAYYKDGKLFVMNKFVCNKEDIFIKGMHNVENYLAAFSAVYGEVSIENMKKIALTFKGVEHRCEFVREYKGVKYYNDSIASSPTRVLAGLKSFDKPVILIAGGYDKKIPFEPLAKEGYKKIKVLILVGLTKYKIKEAFEKIIDEKGIDIPIIVVEDFKEAVYKAKDIAAPGDIVTLSPACASFDMFSNFAERGNKFKEIVMNMS